LVVWWWPGLRPGTRWINGNCNGNGNCRSSAFLTWGEAEGMAVQDTP